MMEVEIELKQKSLLQEIEEDFNEIWKKNKIVKNTFHGAEIGVSDSSKSEITLQNHNNLNNMEVGINSSEDHEDMQRNLNVQVFKEASEQEENGRVDENKMKFAPSETYSQTQISQLKWNETQILKEKITEITKEKVILEDELSRTKCKTSIEKLQFKELQDSLKSEQYFSTLYKKQAVELKEELEETELQYKQLEKECASLKQRSQIDREVSIAQEFNIDADKDKIMVEPKNILVKFHNDVVTMEGTNYTCEDYENNLKMLNEQILMENGDLAKQFKQFQDKLNKKVDERGELNMLRAQLKTEQILKEQAVNKLYEIINRTDYYKQNVELKRNENDFKKFEQEFTLEKEKFNQLISTLQKNLQELTNQLNAETMIKQNLRMELDSKDSEIEQLELKLTSLKGEAASLNSDGNEGDDGNIDSVFEGWLSIPNQRNIREDGWKKQFVVVSSKKVFFYNSERDKENTDPVMILDLCSIFHVRSVTQGEGITADSNDIPRIFQILYTDEGEARKFTFTNHSIVGDAGTENEDKGDTLMHKGHKFVLIAGDIPTTCDVCSKPMRYMFRPPPAVECQRCKIKIHKDHLECEEYNVAPCKLRPYPKELLLLASSIHEQKSWVNRLSKKVEKCGYKANSFKTRNPQKLVDVLLAPIHSLRLF